MRTWARWRYCITMIFLAGNILFQLMCNGVLLAVAESDDSRNALLFYDDIVLRGTSAGHDAYFEVGKGQRVGKESYIDLKISHSSALHPVLSTLTVLVDDVPLGEIYLNDTHINKTNWKLDLSGLQLGPGYHKISLRAYMKLSENLCEDPFNEALWVVADKTSELVLNLEQIYSSADLSWYPSPFIERGGINPLKALLIVPDSIEQVEFAAAARLSQFFAAQVPDGLLQIPIYTESDIYEALIQNHHAIWLGVGGKWKGAGQKLIESIEGRIEQSIQDQGVIVQMPSPWNSSRTHLLVSGNEQQLRVAAEILTTESLYRQMEGNLLQLPDQLNAIMDKEKIIAGQSYTWTFEQLGYKNIKIENVAQGSIQIQHQIPLHSDLGDSVRLHLKYSHSKSILYEKSVMTVNVNGTPLESVRLVEQSSNGGIIEVWIDPSRVGRIRTLDVEIKFQFANHAANRSTDRDPYRCSDNLIGNWAVIDGGSSLTYIPIERQTVYLQHLPFPFMSDGEWEKTTFLFNHINTAELQLAMTFIGKISKGIADVNALQFQSTVSEDLLQKLRNRHIVFIGKGGDLPEAFNGFDGSYVRFSNERVTSISQEVQLLEPLQRNFAVMQITRSPLNRDYHLMLLVADTTERLGMLGRALTDRKENFKISTRFVAVNSKGEVLAFPETEEPIAFKTVTKSSQLDRKVNIKVSGIIFAAVIFVILSIIALAVYRQYRNRYRKH